MAPDRARIVAASAVVYVVRGSTYPAIRFAIETLPGFAMASSRFLRDRRRLSPPRRQRRRRLG